ncbi:Aspartic proteinase CDR1 [Spatholobus suberectus]|nr:Aspartic proteinase CDR1 [Spatholobus suberectus]
MHPLLLCFFSLLFSLSTLSFSTANERLPGCSIDPIPHDSLLSPFDDNSACVSFEFDITAAEYSYLLSLSVTTEGHPTVSTYANLDTGSDLIWLNGEGCEGNACFCNEACIQKPSHDPKRACDVCDKLPEQAHPQCSRTENKCRYKLQYQDEFTTQGMLTKGEFSPTSVDHAPKAKNIWFGVSDLSKGNLNKKSTGVVGLGRGDPSLISQLSEKSSVPFRFSYCLPHPNSKSTGKLLMGRQVTISDNFTPLLTENDVAGCDKHYCVRLASIFLNGDTSEKINAEHKNIIMFIDSGSTFTILNKTLFPEFIQKVKQITGEGSIELDRTFRHCFKQEVGKKLEKVSFEFRRWTTINLKEVNFFHKREYQNEEYLCLMVVEGEKPQNLLGSRAQVDFKVAFGRDDKNPTSEWKVSFDEENCGNEQNVE